jgi:hypothetical protein
MTHSFYLASSHRMPHQELTLAMEGLLLIRLLRSSRMQPEVAAGDFQESVPKFQELVLGREPQEERVFTNRPASLRTIQSREIPVAGVVPVSSWPISVGRCSKTPPFPLQTLMYTQKH